MKRILFASAIAASLAFVPIAVAQQTSSTGTQPTTSRQPTVSHGDTVGGTGKKKTKTKGKSKSGKKAKKTAAPQS